MSDSLPSYRSVLGTRNALRSFLPSIIGRLSLATSGLALVLLLEQSTNSFAIAGTITAVLGISNVVVTPWRARLIDRRGQTVVLGLLGGVHAGALVAVALFPSSALVWLITLAVVAGASSPPFGATMRVVWSTSLTVGSARTRGLSVDAVAEEVTFAVGPLLAATLAVVVDPFVALLVSASFVLVGTMLFITSPLSRQQKGIRSPGSASPRNTVSPLRSRGFPVLVVAMIAPGILLGVVEIAAPAIAAEESSTLLGGVLLAVFAGASAVGGLLYGRLELRAAPGVQVLALTTFSLVGVGTLGLIGGAIAALVGFIVCGLFLAPVLIAGYLAADSLTDMSVRTEASSWINTAVNLGAACGAALFGASTGVTTPGVSLAIGGVVALLVVVACAPFLLRSR